MIWSEDAEEVEFAVGEDMLEEGLCLEVAVLLCLDRGVEHASGLKFGGSEDGGLRLDEADKFEFFSRTKLVMKAQ